MNQVDQILKKELNLSKRMLLTIGIGVTVFCVLSILFCLYIHNATNHVVRRQAVRSITNISQLNKDSVNRSIESRRLMLQTYAEQLEKRDLDQEPVQKILKELEELTQSYNFYTVGFLDATKTVYLTNGEVRDETANEMAYRIWTDHFLLSESYMPFTKGEYAINLFSYPVFYGGELKYVLLASCYSMQLTERMNISSLDGKGYTFLIDRQGKVVVYPRHNTDVSYNVLMAHINDTPQIIPGPGGDTNFEFDGKRYYAHFEELGINDWFLMTCVDEQDLFADANAIGSIVYMTMAVTWVILLLALCGAFYSLHRTKLQRTREMFYDDLLNIPNRKALSVVFDKLPGEILREMYMVIFDIDKFKEFNYIHGSEAGDGLLCYIARTLQEIEPNVFLFRYMSDYFVVLGRSPSDQAYAEKIDLVLERFRQDIENGVIQAFDVSAGVRKVQPGDPVRTVISDALVARDMVKGNHMRAYAFYDAVIRNQRLKFVEMESAFPAALRNNEFRVYYQPKYDMRTGKIRGAEALARWVKPDGSIVSPASFIPCFEANRQICMLDEVMLKSVCSQMKQMLADGLPVKRVSVNLSRVHLRQQGILPKIERIVRESGVNPAYLSFEITESALYEDSIPLKQIIDHLHGLGCRVDMDDYGIGMSSPIALANNRFDVVKLDKSFIDGIDNERVTDAIQTTIYLAQKWGMDILAEGVEEKAQADRLMELGCTLAQGYYYAKPLPEDQYRKLLQAEME